VPNNQQQQLSTFTEKLCSCPVHYFRLLRLKSNSFVQFLINYFYLSGDEDSGLWSSIKSTFSSAGGEGGEEKDEGLNIFCLATGHLYERLLKANTPKKHTEDVKKFSASSIMPGQRVIQDIF
jgi:hypothetical protein